MKKFTTNMSFKAFLWCLLGVFVISLVVGDVARMRNTEARQLGLPNPTQLLSVTDDYSPLVLKGMKINIDDPLKFDFIVDTGHTNYSDRNLKLHSQKLVKYFLAALAIPEKDLWVNLSPYEKDRIVADDFGVTQMGRDLLAQDYILKQLTSSLMYPENESGKAFWNRIHAKAGQIYGTNNELVDAFNKIWAVPDKAVLCKDKDKVFVVDTHFKVMMEEDYLATLKNINKQNSKAIDDTNEVLPNIVKEIIIPEIEREINNGSHFAQLRQIYNSVILAKWYKQNLKQSVLNAQYSDKKMVEGVDIRDKSEKDKIYKQYVRSFEKGVFNYIKKEKLMSSQKLIKRKYFSGGFILSSPIQIVDNADIQTGSSNLKLISGAYSPNGKPAVASSGADDDDDNKNKSEQTIAFNPHDAQELQRQILEDSKNYSFQDAVMNLRYATLDETLAALEFLDEQYFAVKDPEGKGKPRNLATVGDLRNPGLKAVFNHMYAEDEKREVIADAANRVFDIFMNMLGHEDEEIREAIVDLLIEGAKTNWRMAGTIIRGMVFLMLFRGDELRVYEVESIYNFMIKSNDANEIERNERIEDISIALYFVLMKAREREIRRYSLNKIFELLHGETRLGQSEVLALLNILKTSNDESCLLVLEILINSTDFNEGFSQIEIKMIKDLLDRKNKDIDEMVGPILENLQENTIIIESTRDNVKGTEENVSEVVVDRETGEPTSIVSVAQTMGEELTDKNTAAARKDNEMDKAVEAALEKGKGGSDDLIDLVGDLIDEENIEKLKMLVEALERNYNPEAEDLNQVNINDVVNDPLDAAKSSLDDLIAKSNPEPEPEPEPEPDEDVIALGDALLGLIPDVRTQNGADLLIEGAPSTDNSSDSISRSKIPMAKVRGPLDDDSPRDSIFQTGFHTGELEAFGANIVETDEDDSNVGEGSGSGSAKEPRTLSRGGLALTDAMRKFLMLQEVKDRTRDETQLLGSPNRDPDKTQLGIPTTPKKSSSAVNNGGIDLDGAMDLQVTGDTSSVYSQITKSGLSSIKITKGLYPVVLSVSSYTE